MVADLGHPLAVRLQTCHSVDDIAALLQGQAQTFDEPHQRDRIFKSIRTTVSILTPTSVPYITDDVSQKALMDTLMSLTILQTLLPHGKVIYATLGVLLEVCATLQFTCRYPSDTSRLGSQRCNHELRCTRRYARVNRAFRQSSQNIYRDVSPYACSGRNSDQADC